MALAGLVLAGCGGGGGEDQVVSAPTTRAGGTNTTAAAGGADEHADHMGNPTADCSPAGTTLTITVSATKFDRNCLAAPANQAFTINYDNKDQLGHNIAILESHMATDVLYRAEIFRGPRVAALNVGALKPGTYAFHCEVHPQLMSGTFVVK